MALPEPYLEPGRSIDERIEDLLRRMTLAEKAGMLFHTMVMITPDGDLNIDAGAFGGPSYPRTQRQTYHALQSGRLCQRGGKSPPGPTYCKNLPPAQRLGIPITFLD